jgi:phosphoserine phosphatase RsbU/P
MAGPLTHAADAAMLTPLLRGHPIFAPLSPAALDELVRRSSIVTVDAPTCLMSQGDASDAAYLLLSGEADVVVETAYGPVKLAPLASGALIGEIGAFANLPRTATVQARTTLSALRFDRDYIIELGRKHPEILLSVIAQLGQRTATVNRAIGFYTQALAALERHDFDPAILDALLNPVPELVNFAQTFRRMAEQIILRRAQHDEMASAAAIQRAMLPSPLANDSYGGRVELYAEIRPAREVGGDLYDYFLVDPDRLAVVIGDVSGKGVPASLFMAITRMVMRLVLREGRDLASAVGRANELLSAENSESMFATLFCAVLDLNDGLLTYCNCGHNPPIVLRGAAPNEALPLTGLPLAIMSEAPYKSCTITIAPGDCALLYTDGITEATNAGGAQFGEARLDAVVEDLRRGSMRDLVRGVIDRVDEFVSGAPQFDDMTCLALRRSPAVPS